MRQNMKMNKSKNLLIAVFHIVILLCSKVQCSDEYSWPREDHCSGLRSTTKMHYASLNIGDEAAKCIANGIKNNIVLNYVDLNCNHITLEGIKYLAIALKNKPITEFYMSGSKIGDQGHVLLAEAIKTWPNLTHINLNETDLGDVGAEALGDALKDKIKLSVIYIGAGNKLSPEGSEKFFRKLANI